MQSSTRTLLKRLLRSPNVLNPRHFQPAPPIYARTADRTAFSNCPGALSIFCNHSLCLLADQQGI